jgi:2-oxo-4-hydroxy-4-carboxy-5-ureidoimidazoline decarboxylase
LLTASDEIWLSLTPADWLQAFHSHPRIGESSAKAPVAARSAAWSRQEQLQAAAAPNAAKQQFAEANHAYEQQFGHIFIVCATGKSAPEILEILRRRMHNDADTELREAAEQQRQITQLRLKKWLGL